MTRVMRGPGFAAALCASLLLAAGCEPAQSPAQESAPAAAPAAAPPTAAPNAAVVSINLPAADFTLRASTLPGYTLASQKCVICHSTDYISFQPPGMTLAQWTGEMQKMRAAYGAPLVDAEVELIGAYLAVAYGSTPADDPAIAAVTARNAAYLESIKAVLQP